MQWKSAISLQEALTRPRTIKGNLAVEVINCNQRLSHQLTPPFREAMVADTGLGCRRLRPQRAMRFLY